MNADEVNCYCANCQGLKKSEKAKPVENKWANDRLLGIVRSCPDLPVFWTPFFVLLGNYWINQTGHESTDSYLHRCYIIYRRHFLEKYTEAEFVTRVVLGLRSFSWAVACYVRKVKTFREVFELVVEQLESHCFSLSNASWNRVLFRGQKRVSERVIRANLEQVALLRKTVKPPNSLIKEIAQLFHQSLAELKAESSERQEIAQREIKAGIREKVLNNSHYEEKLKPYINLSGLYGSEAYLPSFRV